MESYTEIMETLKYDQEGDRQRTLLDMIEKMYKASERDVMAARFMAGGALLTNDEPLLGEGDRPDIRNLKSDADALQQYDKDMLNVQTHNTTRKDVYESMAVTRAKVINRLRKYRTFTPVAEQAFLDTLERILQNAQDGIAYEIYVRVYNQGCSREHMARYLRRKQFTVNAFSTCAGKMYASQQRLRNIYNTNRRSNDLFVYENQALETILEQLSKRSPPGFWAEFPDPRKKKDIGSIHESTLDINGLHFTLLNYNIEAFTDRVFDQVKDNVMDWEASNTAETRVEEPEIERAPIVPVDDLDRMSDEPAIPAVPEAPVVVAPAADAAPMDFVPGDENLEIIKEQMLSASELKTVANTVSRLRTEFKKLEKELVGCEEKSRKLDQDIQNGNDEVAYLRTMGTADQERTRKEKTEKCDTKIQALRVKIAGYQSQRNFERDKTLQNPNIQLRIDRLTAQIEDNERLVKDMQDCKKRIDNGEKDTNKRGERILKLATKIAGYERERTENKTKHTETVKKHSEMLQELKRNRDLQVQNERLTLLYDIAIKKKELGKIRDYNVAQPLSRQLKKAKTDGASVVWQSVSGDHRRIVTGPGGANESGNTGDACGTYGRNAGSGSVTGSVTGSETGALGNGSPVSTTSAVTGSGERICTGKQYEHALHTTDSTTITTTSTSSHDGSGMEDQVYKHSGPLSTLYKQSGEQVDTAVQRLKQRSAAFRRTIFSEAGKE